MDDEITICRYFLRGTCRFGEDCRFHHPFPIDNDPDNIPCSSNCHFCTNSNYNNHNHNNNTGEEVKEDKGQNNNKTKNTDNNLTSINSLKINKNNSNLNESLTTSKKIHEQKDPNNWAMAPVFVPRRQRQQPSQPQQNRPTTTATITDIIEIDDDEPEVIGAAGTSSSSNHMMDTDFGNGLDMPSSSGAGASSSPSTSASALASGSTASIFSAKSYAEVLSSGDRGSSAAVILDHKSSELCPYEVYCTYGEYCVYQHGDLCDMCGRYCLHPTDKEQRRKHINECIHQHEKDMEISFAIARSKDKTCGVCFDVIVEKTGREQRFGILPNCNHVFCLSCIRKWRQAKQFESKITRACPECRTPSDFVCPSPYWVDTKEDKEKLLDAYKSALGKKDCKYFKKGEGKCPFGNKCFYKHALPNGQLVDVGVPQKNTRKVTRSDDEILELFDQVFPQIYLWDFVDRRGLMSRLTASETPDDSDWSEEEDYYE